MNKKRIFQIAVEIGWIVMALFCLIVGIVYQSRIGADKIWLMYVLSGVSICMFFVRRLQRKNNEKRRNRYSK